MHREEPVPTRTSASPGIHGSAVQPASVPDYKYMPKNPWGVGQCNAGTAGLAAFLPGASCSLCVLQKGSDTEMFNNRKIPV